MTRHLRKGRLAKKSRKESALIRQENYSNLANNEKLFRLMSRGHNHCKEALALSQDVKEK